MVSTNRSSTKMFIQAVIVTILSWMSFDWLIYFSTQCQSLISTQRQKDKHVFFFAFKVILPSFTSKHRLDLGAMDGSTLALEARCYIQGNEEWGPSGLADWRGEECEGDKVQQEHSVQVKNPSWNIP